ncbi:MAG: hypothetical protein ABIQ30_02395 [Devosia sp.]
MSSTAVASDAKREGHSIGFNLAVIAVAAALLGLGFAYSIDAAGRADRHAHQGNLARTLGGTQLEIPANWFRDEDAERAEGFAKQVELALDLPFGMEGAIRTVDVTLVPRSRARPSASLLDGVYLHQFMPEQLVGPPGLIGKPLIAKEGFENETIWYDPLSAAPFVAKCLAAVADGAHGRCLRTVYLGAGIAAVYSFDDDLLASWKQFDARIHPLMQQIGAL